VRVTESGKRPYEAKVSLREAELRTIQVTLEAEPSVAVWPWIVGAAVVAGGAVVGGYFLLRPPDPSPPQAGTLGSLQFQGWRR
jgi:hypothetical protein